MFSLGRSGGIEDDVTDNEVIQLRRCRRPCLEMTSTFRTRRACLSSFSWESRRLLSTLVGHVYELI